MLAGGAQPHSSTLALSDRHSVRWARTFDTSSHRRGTDPLTAKRRKTTRPHQLQRMTFIGANVRATPECAGEINYARSGAACWQRGAIVVCYDLRPRE